MLGKFLLKFFLNLQNKTVAYVNVDMIFTNLRSRAHFSSTLVAKSDDPTTALAHREAPKITIDQSLRSKEEVEREKMLRGKFVVEGPINVAATSVRLILMKHLRRDYNIIFIFQQLPSRVFQRSTSKDVTFVSIGLPRTQCNLAQLTLSAGKLNLTQDKDGRTT